MNVTVCKRNDGYLCLSLYLIKFLETHRPTFCRSYYRYVFKFFWWARSVNRKSFFSDADVINSVQLVSKISNLCDPDDLIHQRYRSMDRRIDRRTDRRRASRHENESRKTRGGERELFHDHVHASLLTVDPPWPISSSRLSSFSKCVINERLRSDSSLPAAMLIGLNL